MNIEFVNLKAQYENYKGEIDAAIQSVLILPSLLWDRRSWSLNKHYQISHELMRYHAQMEPMH